MSASTTLSARKAPRVVAPSSRTWAYTEYDCQVLVGTKSPWPLRAAPATPASWSSGKRRLIPVSALHSAFNQSVSWTLPLTDLLLNYFQSTITPHDDPRVTCRREFFRQRVAIPLVDLFARHLPHRTSEDTRTPSGGSPLKISSHSPSALSAARLHKYPQSTPITGILLSPAGEVAYASAYHRPATHARHQARYGSCPACSCSYISTIVGWIGPALTACYRSLLSHDILDSLGRCGRAVHTPSIGHHVCLCTPTWLPLS